ncbi:hypothetical protein PsSCT_43760 [Pseudomonas sp. SCT]
MGLTCLRQAEFGAGFKTVATSQALAAPVTFLIFWPAAEAAPPPPWISRQGITELATLNSTLQEKAGHAR